MANLSGFTFWIFPSFKKQKLSQFIIMLKDEILKRHWNCRKKKTGKTHKEAQKASCNKIEKEKPRGPRDISKLLKMLYIIC